MDIWGTSSIDAEAELIALLINTFKSMGLTGQDVGIKVS